MRQGMNAFEWNDFRMMLSVANELQLDIMIEMIEANKYNRELAKKGNKWVKDDEVLLRM